MRLGEPQGWCRRVQKIAPPLAFDPRTAQPITCRYPGLLLYRKLFPLLTENECPRSLSKNESNNNAADLYSRGVLLESRMVHRPYAYSTLMFLGTVSIAK